MIVLQSIGKMFCTFITNLIEMEVQPGKCLYEMENERENEKIELMSAT